MIKLKLENENLSDFIETMLYNYDVILELRNHKVIIRWPGFSRNSVPYHHTITNLSETEIIREYDVVDYANIAYCYSEYMKELYPSLAGINFPWSEVSINMRK